VSCVQRGRFQCVQVAKNRSSGLLEGLWLVDPPRSGLVYSFLSVGVTFTLDTSDATTPDRPFQTSRSDQAGRGLFLS